MEIEDVGKEVLEKTKGLGEKGQKKKRRKEEYKENKKMARSFENSGNYSSAYFQYFQTAKSLAKIYVESILEDSGMDGIAALKFISDKGKFDVGSENFDYLLKRFDQFLMRAEIEKEDVDRIKKLISKLEKGLKEKDLLN